MCYGFGEDDLRSDGNAFFGLGLGELGGFLSMGLTLGERDFFPNRGLTLGLFLGLDLGLTLGLTLGLVEGDRLVVDDTDTDFFFP